MERRRAWRIEEHPDDNKLVRRQAFLDDRPYSGPEIAFADLHKKNTEEQRDSVPTEEEAE